MLRRLFIAVVACMAVTAASIESEWGYRVVCPGRAAWPRGEAATKALSIGGSKSAKVVGATALLLFEGVAGDRHGSGSTGSKTHGRRSWHSAKGTLYTCHFMAAGRRRPCAPKQEAGTRRHRLGVMRWLSLSNFRRPFDAAPEKRQTLTAFVG